MSPPPCLGTEFRNRPPNVKAGESSSWLALLNVTGASAVLTASGGGGGEPAVFRAHYDVDGKSLKFDIKVHRVLTFKASELLPYLCRHLFSKSDERGVQLTPTTTMPTTTASSTTTGNGC